MGPNNSNQTYCKDITHTCINLDQFNGESTGYCGYCGGETHKWGDLRVKK